MEMRCDYCQKRFTIEHMVLRTQINVCLSCHKSYPSAQYSEDRRLRTMRNRRARANCRKAFDNTCCECDTPINGRTNRHTWRLVPLTKHGRHLMSALNAEDRYNLPPEVLRLNFVALCRYHYQKWSDSREE